MYYFIICHIIIYYAIIIVNILDKIYHSVKF